MNKQGKIVLEIMVFLVIAVLISATILFLVQSGVIKTKDSGADVSVLNTEFLPMGREGYLAIKEFKFCDYVDEDLNCLNELDSFERGQDVYILFMVESSVSNGDVMLVRNYRMTNPQGEVVLEVDEKNNYNFGLQSKKARELITIADYIPTRLDYVAGEYTVDLIIDNPLLNKKITGSEKFMLEPDFKWEVYE